MTIINWPSGIRPRGGNWHLSVSSGTAGRGLAGHQQIIARENRFWQCDLGVVIDQPWHAPIWQAFVDDLMGMAHRIRLPVCNLWRPVVAGAETYHYPDIGITPEQLLHGVEYSDLALFDDGAGFDLPGIRDPRTAAAAPAGATILPLVGETAALMAVGCYFSVEGYLHRVAANEAGTIRFNPPLRQAVAAGVEINVSSPKIICRLADDAGGRLALDQRIGWRGASVTVSVVEAFDR